MNEQLAPMCAAIVKLKLNAATLISGSCLLFALGLLPLLRCFLSVLVHLQLSVSLDLEHTVFDGLQQPVPW